MKNYPLQGIDEFKPFETYKTSEGGVYKNKDQEMCIRDRRVRCVAADSIYANNANRKFCTKYGISTSFVPVSYTHLDVYKRQSEYFLLSDCRTKV